MVTHEAFRNLALSFPQAEEQGHWGNPSFRIKKKIFATLDIANNRACLKLSEMDQFAFCAFDNTVIFPVPNKWGKQGWTFVNLEKVPEDTFKDALTTAYCKVAPKKPAVAPKK